MYIRSNCMNGFLINGSKVIFRNCAKENCQILKYVSYNVDLVVTISTDFVRNIFFQLNLHYVCLYLHNLSLRLNIRGYHKVSDIF